MAEDIRKLRDEAQKAQAAGKWKKGVELYQKLATLEPAEAQWPQRAGECLRKLDRAAEAIEQFEMAARIYAQRGFLVKAIAVAKIILQIDPSNTRAQEAVLQLNTQRGIPTPPPKVPVAPIETPPPAAANQPLESLELRNLVQPAPPAPPPERSIELELEELQPPPAGAPVVPDLLAGPPPPPGPRPPPPPPPRSSLPPGVVEIPVAAAPEEAPAPGIGQEELRRTPLFSDLSEADLTELIARCHVELRDPGEIIIAEGEPGDSMYIVAEGSVRVVRGHPPIQLAELGEGAFFGEIALATDAPRQASVVAVTPTSLLVVPRHAINEVVRKSETALGVLIAFLRDRLVSGVLATAPIFAPFSADERSKIAARFRFLEARANEPIVVQGERSRGLYVILVCGALAIKDTAAGEQVLGHLKSGDVFGEMSLLNHEEAVATVRTTSKVWLLELPGRAFLELVMTHPQFLDYVGELADQRKRTNERSLAAAQAQHATFV